MNRACLRLLPLCCLMVASCGTARHTNRRAAAPQADTGDAAGSPRHTDRPLATHADDHQVDTEATATSTTVAPPNEAAPTAPPIPAIPFQVSKET